MVSCFNYRKSDEQIFNDIVDGVIMSYEMTSGGVKDTKAYSELQADINTNLAKHLTEGTRFASKFEAKGRDILKDPNINKNKDVRATFDAVIAEIANVAIPLSASKTYGSTFMDVHQIGWGDTARFPISSNDLFKVNEIAEGIHRGTLQPIYNKEVTVNCGTIEIATSVDWYAVASGNFDWGQFAFRMGRSYDGYIMLKAIAAMTSATTSMGAAYSVAGVTSDLWSKVTERVSAANGGSAVYGIGTLGALNQVMPSTVGLQYGLGEEMTKTGYLDRYLGVGLIPIDQVIVPGTVNTTAQLAVPANKIFIVGAEGYKPVKVVIEGNSTYVEADPTQNSDKTYGVSIQLKVGVAAICGSKFGTVTLAG